MSTELLELRKKALEACGWKVVMRSDAYARMILKGVPPGSVVPLLAAAPAVESDPAVSEPWFDDLCAHRGWKWELHRTRNGKVICIITEFDDCGDENELANVRANKPSEARAMAIIAASDKEKP